MNQISAMSPSFLFNFHERELQIQEQLLDRVHKGWDRVFSFLFVAQWIFALLLAVFWSPFAWAGLTRTLHLHVYVAVFFGAALTIPPILIARLLPGRPLTRHVIAMVQMLWSALLIHLSGGRIETHFHVFGSLAFLAFYRDHKILFTATAVVIFDHLTRAMLWPESVYGLKNPEWWRFLEHAFWILFENIVLVMSIIDSRRTTRVVSKRQAEIEMLNDTLEQKVIARTEALSLSNEKLSSSLDELKSMQKQLLDASRKAGMADIATSILHNIGNVLNSVNVSASLAADTIRTSKASGLAKACALLQSQPEPERFLAEDPKGKRLISYFVAVSQAINNENAKVSEELASLCQNIEHIKVIVSMQQSYAKQGGVKERISLHKILEDALRTNMASSESHDISTRTDFDDIGEIECDRHKLFQILINLLSNANQALNESQAPEKILIVRTRRDGDDVRIEVEDNGVGIKAQNLNKIFSHGFTTKKTGHGFGLHSSANTAAEMGGRLQAYSDGEGRGARFVLRIPAQLTQHKLAA